MATCSHCGTESEGAKFCPECGGGWGVAHRHAAWLRSFAERTGSRLYRGWAEELLRASA